MASIPLTDHIRKLTRVYIFAEDINRLLKTDSIKEALLAQKIKTLDETLEELNIEKQDLPDELKEKIEGIVEEQKRFIEEYQLTIVNQSLQIACSLFEAFLIESLNAILVTKEQTIIGLAEQRSIKLEDVINLGDYNQVISYFKDKILTNFSRASTKEQFEKYFGELGFEIQKFFDMSNYKEKVQETYKGWDIEKLISIFHERHDIVHNGELPLISLEDLHIRKEFLRLLIMNISIELFLKFKIKNDLNLPLSLLKLRN
jgi:hypothetical protein